MTAEPKYYSCDDEQWYTHDEVAAMFQSFLDKYRRVPITRTPQRGASNGLSQ